MPFYTEVFVDICTLCGIESENARRHFIQSAGYPIFTQFEICFSLEGVEHDAEIVKKCGEDFWASTKNAPAPLFSGARETLIKFHELGMTLFATSGSNDDELKVLFANNSLPSFSLILGSSRIPKGVEHIRIFADHLCMPMEQFATLAILFGDGPTDMRIAKECGIVGVGLTTTTTAQALISAGATITIPSLSKALAI